MDAGLLGGRYELRDILGFGGMAEVRDGWDTRMCRPVAIKLLHPGLSLQSGTRERFRVEARAAAALHHPNVVGVYDFGDQGGTPFIVMERLPGETLGDLIERGPLSQAEVRAVLSDVLSALAAAHAAEMVHRDIKPGNILLSPTGGAKVADFGIVKAPGSVHTTTGHIVGTLAYLSPDRVLGEPASVGDDLYAVGVVGYEALTGRKPFAQEDIIPLARAIIEEEPPSLASLRPDVDPRLAEVIERAMSRDPQRRYCSADAMRAALLGDGAQHTVPGPVWTGTRRRTPIWARHARPHSSSVHGHARSVLARRVAGSAAVLSAIALAVVAIGPDTSPTTRPVTPERAVVSTPLPVSATATAVPSPIGEPPPAAPTLVVEQVTQQQTPVREIDIDTGPPGGPVSGPADGPGKGNHGVGPGSGKKPGGNKGKGKPK